LHGGHLALPSGVADGGLEVRHALVGLDGVTLAAGRGRPRRWGWRRCGRGRRGRRRARWRRRRRPGCRSSDRRRRRCCRP
jgi:hypothetical protein